MYSLGVATPPPINLLSVSEVCRTFRADMERKMAAGALAATTADTYSRDLTDFARLAGSDRPLDDISADEVDDIVLAYKFEPDRRRKIETQTPKSDGTVRRFRQSVSRLFTFAERRSYIQRNPMPDTVTRPKAPDRAAGARSALPLRSAQALVSQPQQQCTPQMSDNSQRKPRADQQLGQRDELIIRILIEAGPRVSELCSLDLSDIDHQPDATWLEIRKGKGGKSRAVPLSPSTANLLKEHVNQRQQQTVQAENKGDPWADKDSATALFVTFRGRRIQPRDVQNLVRRASNKVPANLRKDVTPHGLRHTMATLLLSSGAADVSVVQKMLGHASLATTGVYLDEIRDDLVRAVNDHPLHG